MATQQRCRWRSAVSSLILLAAVGLGACTDRTAPVEPKSTIHSAVPLSKPTSRIIGESVTTRAGCAFVAGQSDGSVRATVLDRPELPFAFPRLDSVTTPSKSKPVFHFATWTLSPAGPRTMRSIIVGCFVPYDKALVRTVGGAMRAVMSTQGWERIEMALQHATPIDPAGKPVRVIAGEVLRAALFPKARPVSIRSTSLGRSRLRPLAHVAIRGASQAVMTSTSTTACDPYCWNYEDTTAAQPLGPVYVTGDPGGTFIDDGWIYETLWRKA